MADKIPQYGHMTQINWLTDVIYFRPVEHKQCAKHSGNCQVSIYGTDCCLCCKTMSEIKSKNHLEASGVEVMNYTDSCNCNKVVVFLKINNQK